jgi:hypothetical protein
MDAVQRSSNWNARRVAVGVAALMAATLLAGGTGGYLFRGAATVAVHQTTSAASRAPAHAATLPSAGNSSQRTGVWSDSAAASLSAAGNSPHRAGIWSDGVAGATLPSTVNTPQRTGVWSDSAQ